MMLIRRIITAFAALSLLAYVLPTTTIGKLILVLATIAFIGALAWFSWEAVMINRAVKQAINPDDDGHDEFEDTWPGLHEHTGD